MRLTLIAHGATAATKNARFPADEPLLASEQERARKLRRSLPVATQCHVSPAAAACNTVQAMGLDAVGNQLLRDLNFGRWAGSAIEDIARDEPQGLSEWLSDPSSTPHGGESVSSLIERTRQYLAFHLEHRGKIVAVCHQSNLRAAVLITLGAPPQAFWQIDIDPLATAVLSSDGRRWVLKFVTLGGEL